MLLPNVIISQQISHTHFSRQKYYELLTKANQGDIRPFVRFIAYCTDETLNTYLGCNKKVQQITDNSDGTPVITIDDDSRSV